MSILRWNPKRDKNELELVAQLERLGYISWPISGAGLPDRLLLKRGVWALAELKSKKGKLTPAQKDFFNIARAARGPVYVLRDLDDIILMDASLFSSSA